MAFGGCSMTELTDVFREHLLHHLPVSSLARLRAASKALRAFADIGDHADLFPSLSMRTDLRPDRSSASDSKAAAWHSQNLLD